ncbi:MAG: hypothetical protein BroJett040_15900 [Oligoflexia bacterium]|nr:MAG: hypothetical protein BroJett040_15900 [Oligoflexia bacterium]
MRTLLIFIVLFFSALAQAENLFCQISVGMEVTSKTEIAVDQGETKSFGNYGEYFFKVKNRGKSQFTIEVFNGSEPSRGYADGVLRQVDDEVKWSLWTREILIEGSCQLQ